MTQNGHDLCLVHDDVGHRASVDLDHRRGARQRGACKATSAGPDAGDAPARAARRAAKRRQSAATRSTAEPRTRSSLRSSSASLACSRSYSCTRLHDGDEGRVAQQLAGVLARRVGDAAHHALVVDPRVLDGRDGRRVDAAQRDDAALVEAAQRVDGELAGRREDDGGVVEARRDRRSLSPAQTAPSSSARPRCSSSRAMPYTSQPRQMATWVQSEAAEPKP